jgi:ribose/xylose/arabinose/galactoside ABC-type transport system permease subunit
MQVATTRTGADWSRLNHLFLLAAVLAIAAAISHGVFVRPANLVLVLASASAFGLVSFGQALVVISGGFDLSVGSLVAMSISAVVCFRSEFGIVGGTIAAVVLACGAGLLSGFVVARTRIPPFIVTLGMMSIADSMSWLLAAGQPITVEELNDSIAPLFSFLPLSENAFPILVMLLGLAVTGLLLHQSKWGRYIYAIGDNESAARIVGTPILGTKLLVYGLSGCLSAVAAIVYLYQNISATPGEGADYLLLSFAATIIGGVNMYGGSGSMLGVVVGVLCLASITSALTIAGVPPAIYPGVLGIIVLAVVVVQSRLRR